MKIQVGVMFGGASVEHEISILSAMQVMKALDHHKYDIIPIYIAKDKEMYTGEAFKEIEQYKDITTLLKNKKTYHFVKKQQYFYLEQKHGWMNKKAYRIDIVFPILHGTNGEDGSIQGYLKTIGIPFCQSDVCACAIGQDKVIMKKLLSYAKIPIAPWFYTTVEEVNKSSLWLEKAEHLGYPLIIKPANLGSSIGIQLVENQEQLYKAIIEAFAYDEKVVVEKVIENMREVNASVLGDREHYEVSCLEEVHKHDLILSYEDKYQGSGKSKGMVSTSREIPAVLSFEQENTIKELAKQVAYEMEISGVVRIDFLIDVDHDTVLVNEMNTIPGSLAFYLWEPKDLTFTDLLDRILTIALKQYRRKEKMIVSYETNILKDYDQRQGLKGKG
ncbi:MAG: D-alanine--D-alanine ligase [Erysipelotrichaceae bacterium]|nr:D-alanine--D-alanine ligase [Erysipelotrichaceae bacterium]